MAVWMTLGVLFASAGCAPKEFKEFFSPKTDAPEPAPAPAADVDPLIRDTIGYHTLYSGATGLQVRGFGLVVGLGENGSTDCPSAVRDYLIDFMNREYLPTNPGAVRGKFSAAKLVDSPDSAPVQITAVIPPGAPRGTMLDLQVTALPGTSTKSLDGGLLLPCELRLFDTNASGSGMLQGRIVAKGGGPIFVNPFVKSDNSGLRNPRSGLVLGGGRTIEARTLQLQLIEPSYPLARKIERRINERFGHSPPTGEAMSQGYLLVHPPKAYVDRTVEFLGVLPFCPMQEDEGFRSRRAAELVEIARRSPELQPRVADAWEALGNVVLPVLKPLYDERGALGYYAARAGLRLGDATAAPVVGHYARAGSDRIALEAIRELGNRRMAYAAEPLVPLLNSDDVTVRVSAYEALAKMGHPLIKRKVYASVLDPAQAGVIVDHVATDGPPLIYFKRTRSPRIALIGRGARVQTPLLYTLDDDRLTVTSTSPGELTLFARGRTSGRLSDKIVVPADLPSLVRAMADQPQREGKQLRGLGLSYSEVVRVLSEMIDQELIGARLVPETINVTDIVGPLPIRERPATDAEAAQRSSAGERPIGGRSRDASAPSGRRDSDADAEVPTAQPPETDGEAPVLSPRARPQQPPKSKPAPDSLWDD